MKARRKRDCSLRLKVNDKLVEAVSAEGLCRIIGKTKQTLMRYESVGIFPLAPIIYGKMNSRYYPISLAKRLVPLVRAIPLNRKIASELQFKIHKLFKDEKV